MWEGLRSKHGYLGTKGWMSSPTEEAAMMPGSDSHHATRTGGEGACSLHDQVGWVDKRVGG